MATTTRSRTEKKSSPRREALNRERIVKAALELADTRGDFSMRALGEKLKADPMAMYRHFRNKEALIDATVDAALSGVVPVPPDWGSAPERLRQLCLDFRAALEAHPGVAVRVSTAEPNLGAHTIGLVDAFLGLLREFGLDASEAIRGLLVVVRFVTGVAAAEERVRSVGGTEAGWRDQMAAGYVSVATDELPNIASLAAEVSHVSFQESFEYGLDVILDGLVRRGEMARKRREEATGAV
jgi:AcrR family transcriptional regulator